MANQMINRVYTIGTIDGSQDITPGVAQTSFRDFSLLSNGNQTRIVVAQGALWAKIVVTKVGAILRPDDYEDGSSGVGSTVTFSAGTVVVTSDLGHDDLVYNDWDGVAHNAEGVLKAFSPETLVDLKIAPIPDDGQTVAYLRNVATDDRKSAFYFWDPDETATADDFNYVVSSLSATGRWVRMRVSGAVSRSFATLAALKAIGSEEFTQGELIELRGIAAEGDVLIRPVGTWQASSTNTDALDKTFVRLDDTSGANPGRVQFPNDINTTFANKVLTSNTTLAVSNKYLLNSTGGVFTVTLPASPAANSTVELICEASVSTNAVSLDPNGATINAESGTGSLNVGNTHWLFRFASANWTPTLLSGAV